MDAALPRKGSWVARTGLRARAFDAALIACAHAACVLALWKSGFLHVSDDDFARTVIAQGFAHAAKLDPSGTSWLPVPFYLTGLAMKVCGTTFAVAKATSFLLTTASLVVFYGEARRSFTAPRWSLQLTFLWLATFPWLVFVGGAAVPEGYTALWVATAVGSLASPRVRVLPAVLLLLATLCRYEAWSAALAFAILRPLFASKGSRVRAAGIGALPLAGPLAWMLWNRYSHGEYTHFVTRVTKYRAAFESQPLSFRVLQYPRALAEVAPECAILAVITLASFVLLPKERQRSLRGPFLAGLFMLLFLIAGNMKDGAPTHHAVRALLPLACILGPSVAEACVGIAERIAGTSLARKTWIVGLVAGGILVYVALLPARLRDFPGKGEAEGRAALLAQGRALQSVARVEVEPCAYEHFALIAGYEHPERVSILPRKKTETAPCPRVTELTTP